MIFDLRLPLVGGVLCASLACSSPAPAPPAPPAPSAPASAPKPASSQAASSFVAAPKSLPLPPPATAPAPPPGSIPASYPVAPPKTIEAALGDKGSLFPKGFEALSMDWRAEDLIRERPWVVNEGRLSPQLSYLYREAAYDAGTGRGDNRWLIENTVFGAVEYHFQHDASGSPVGPLHKVVFLFEVSLPKDAVERIRKVGDAKWGAHKTLTDQFQVSYDSWAEPSGVDVLFHYSPGGSIAESLEFVSESVLEAR